MEKFSFIKRKKTLKIQIQGRIDDKVCFNLGMVGSTLGEVIRQDFLANILEVQCSRQIYGMNCKDTQITKSLGMVGEGI
jgi:hypothetical protein